MVQKFEIWFSPAKENRRIHLYLPNDYYRTDERYPVIYMFDGHNLYFDSDATSFCGTRTVKVGISEEGVTMLHIEDPEIRQLLLKGNTCLRLLPVFKEKRRQKEESYCSHPLNPIVQNAEF